MTIDIDRLRAAAEKATPGPLTISKNGAPNCDGSPWGRFNVGTFTWSGWQGLKDAEYLVACDPTTIIALCDEVARLRKERDEGIVQAFYQDGERRLEIDRLQADVARLRQELGQPLETERECERLRELLRQCWYWFDDHDDRMTSAEIHKALKDVLCP